jgi:signal transduction histidine kinase
VKITPQRVRHAQGYWWPSAIALLPFALVFLADIAALVLFPTGLLRRGLLGAAAVVVVVVPTIYLGRRHGREASIRSKRMYTLMSRIARSRRDLTGRYNRERHRLQRDLHDSLGPVLATAVMRIDSVRRLVGTESAAADSALLELREDTRAALGEIRRLIYELRPVTVNPLGLQAALRAQAERFNRASSGKLRVTLTTAGDPSTLPPDVGIAIFRIVSEALTNVARHAAASRCDIVITVAGQAIVEVTDDGVGIRQRGQRGLGLGSIQERVKELGGRCSFDALRPHGTRVWAEIPLQNKEEEQRGDAHREEGATSSHR